MFKSLLFFILGCMSIQYSYAKMILDEGNNKISISPITNKNYFINSHNVSMPFRCNQNIFWTKYFNVIRLRGDCMINKNKMEIDTGYFKDGATIFPKLNLTINNKKV